MSNNLSMPLESVLLELCKSLRLPTIARNGPRLAQEAKRQAKEPLSFLIELLENELAERADRRAQRCIKEAGFPIVKTLDGFDFSRAAHLPEARLRALSDGQYIDLAEPVIFLGEPGTGKTHLATALGVAAASGGKSVRFITTPKLVNELIEAKDARQLGKVVSKYSRIDLLILDELGYLPLQGAAAELLFQVLSDRNERRSVVITTNLPFGEWTQVFTDLRLCRAIIDRITHRAHIIETGSHSARLQETIKRNQRKS